MYGRSVCAKNFKIIGLPFKRKPSSAIICTYILSIIYYIPDVLNDSNTLSVGEKMFNYIKTSSKMSWQVRRLQCLSSEFMKRHSKCPYTPLYNYYTDPKTTESSGGQLSLYQVFGFLLAILKRVLPKVDPKLIMRMEQ